jgi:aryl sulfotransferase
VVESLLAVYGSFLHPLKRHSRPSGRPYTALSEESIAEIVHAVSFSTVKEKATKDPLTGSEVWKGGMKTFFFKGTNGRWQGVLSEDELAMYETTKAQVLTPECALWLEKGRAAFV